MKATLSDNRVVNIRFEYNNCDSTIYKGSIAKNIVQNCSSCTINDKDKNVIASGTVKRYHADAPNKILGRRLAFEAAIQSFSKADRAILWGVFRENVKQK